MKKIIPFFIMICCLLAVSSCSYDNFEEPKATLTGDRKSTRLNSSHNRESRMPSSA